MNLLFSFVRLGILLGLVGLTACVSNPTVTANTSASVFAPDNVLVSGDHACRPSQDLPAKKTMKKVPEADTPMEDLYSLLAQERRAHYDDILDYNSLASQCLAPSK